MNFNNQPINQTSHYLCGFCKFDNDTSVCKGKHCGIVLKHGVIWPFLSFFYCQCGESWDTTRFIREMKCKRCRSMCSSSTFSEKAQMMLLYLYNKIQMDYKFKNTTQHDLAKDKEYINVYNKFLKEIQ